MSHHHPQRNQVFGGRVGPPQMFSPNQVHNNNNNNGGGGNSGSHFMIQDQQYLGNFSNVPPSNGYWGNNVHLDYNQHQTNGLHHQTSGLHHQTNGLHHQTNGLHHHHQQQPNGLQHQTMVNDFSPREMLFPQAQILTSPGNNLIYFSYL
jgi:hypothetical protein